MRFFLNFGPDGALPAGQKRRGRSVIADRQSLG